MDRKIKQLIAFRENKGYSQENFARLMGITLQTQYKVENGIIPASRNYMSKFKGQFPDVSIDAIFFNEKAN